MRLWENPQPLVNAEAFCRGYAQKQRLTAAEIAAIPWLMRLRNASIWLHALAICGSSLLG
jgi:Ser/Thr protein kinase RdoA (MazF antagonist)